MRLICPNCGAQYEVPEEVIPQGGRDVQCSECSNTWFQHHPDHPPEEDHTPDPVIEDREDLTAELASDTDDYGVDEIEEPAAEPTPEPAPEPEPEPDYGSEPEPAPELAPQKTGQPTIPRRTLDADVADVLRQEAEREAQARETDHRGGIETQQELGLSDSDDGTQKRSEEARARMARMRGLPDTDPVADDGIDPSSRRNLLPDIEEINSSLGPDAARDDAIPMPPPADPNVAPRPKSGFRSGFRLAILLAVLGLLIYVFAPQLSNAVPALAGPLSSFVDTVNSGRTALSDMMQNLATSLPEEG